jgi:hypothetical protein
MHTRGGSYKLKVKQFDVGDFVYLSLLHIVPFCEGPNKKFEGFAKEKQKT